MYIVFLKEHTLSSILTDLCNSSVLYMKQMQSQFLYKFYKSSVQPILSLFLYGLSKDLISVICIIKILCFTCLLKTEMHFVSCIDQENFFSVITFYHSFFFFFYIKKRSLILTHNIVWSSLMWSFSQRGSISWQLNHSFAKKDIA